MDDFDFNLLSGDVAVILGFNSKCNFYRKKLFSLGFVPGVQFKVKKVAPLGDSFEITIMNGGSFIIRKYEVEMLDFIKI